MKIQHNYHYVPKELITNTAIHDAVVYALEQAGGKKRKDFGNYDYERDFTIGLIIHKDKDIIWSGAGGHVCVTLQQLFNHENFKWPEDMDSIGYSEKGKVVFYGERGYSYIDYPVDYEHPEFVWMPLNLRPKDITLIATKENKGENTMSNEFTTDMLVAGKHLVKFRTGSVAVYIGNDILQYTAHIDRWANLKQYSDKLLHTSSSEWDIVAIYEVSAPVSLNGFKDINLSIVWERNEKSQQEIEYDKLMEQIAELQKQAEKLKPI